MYETQDLLDLIFIFSKFCVSCIMRVVMNYLMLGCVSLCNKKLFYMPIIYVELRHKISLSTISDTLILFYLNCTQLLKHRL